MGMMGGVDSRVTWPQPLPPANLEKPALPVSLPSLRSGPGSPGPEGPKTNFRPLLRPQTLLLATIIRPQEKQMTTPCVQPRPKHQAAGGGGTLGRGGVKKPEGSLPNPRVREAGYCGNKPLPAKQNPGGRRGARPQRPERRALSGVGREGRGPAGTAGQDQGMFLRTAPEPH